MKLFLCVVVFGVITFGSFSVDANLLGSRKCSRGPGYWCENIRNAKQCSAVRHCIQTVWESLKVKEDNDSVCQICKDMVTQARDQLRSNETIDLIKQVFDGSCRLIPIPPIAHECMTLSDNFIPELIETLASEMNPDQVCSVSGLCNNAKFDEMINDHYSQALENTGSNEKTVVPITKIEKPHHSNMKPLSCNGCNDISKTIVSKFRATSRDHVSESLLELCSHMSSFVDACQNIVLVYFNDIYDHLKKNLHPEGICHMSGVCAGNFHQHPEGIEIQTKSDVGFVPVENGDNIPCEMCEQLIHHLRDLLVANTTELEFKQVLQGLCNQTKGFKDECLGMVDQYYAVIYNDLVNNLDANGACFMIGVCPKGSSNINGLLPLLSLQDDQKMETTIDPIKSIGANEPVFTQQQIADMQLPIDKLMGAVNPTLLVGNGELCTVCEYFLHFVQEALASPVNEEKIRQKVENACQKVPKGFSPKCRDFVEMYGDAIIALLIQGLNPRDVCPKLEMCTESSADIEIFSPEPIQDSDVNSVLSNKATCPLCLLAVAQAQALVQTDKSKDNIKRVLANLCNHLPEKEYKLKEECIDFVKTYFDELEDKLISDFTPQEICEDLKVCTDKRSFVEKLAIVPNYRKHDEVNQENDSNESIDDIITLEETAPLPNCILCEEVVKVAEKKYVHTKSKDDIIRALKTSCGKLKTNVREECFKYIDKYGDKIADLILKEMTPKLICREIGLCSEPEDLEIDEAVKYVSFMPADDFSSSNDDEMIKDPECILCEFVMSKIENEVNKHEGDIETTVKNICSLMPKTVHGSCTKFIDQYAKTLIALLETVAPKDICREIQMCLGSLDNIIKDDVVECGVCYGATEALANFLAGNKEQTLNKHQLIDAACQELPPKYYEICSEMVSIYGISMKNLVSSEHTDKLEVCSKIGKCFSDESPVGAFVQITDARISKN